jgi:predicted AAA+ superfamily ATPase
MGMRKVGKTTLMLQVYDDFEGKRLWFDPDNPLDQMGFESIGYDSMYRDLATRSGVENNERFLVCIDEISNLPEITTSIKYLIDHFGVKFIVT